MKELLLQYLSGIRWQDLFDIIISSYMLFRFYVLFRNTIVFRILIGLVLLWFFQSIANSLGLIVTSWAVRAITAAAALIIIVVFRNEIRSVLQAKNLKAILWGFTHSIVSTPLEIIIDTVYDMAKRRCGALIVFPGKEDLKEVVQNGIQWNGVVSKEMILSIFWHDNPVHDGAIVIKGDQITEVSVILPLSHRQDLPSVYGTRHRAAVGLAEDSDALIIVVSEERGTVTIAKNAHYMEITKKERLEELLEEHIGVMSNPVEQLKKEKLKFGIAAVLCVIFVTGVWFSFTRGLSTLISMEIPVEYMNLDSGMEIWDTSANAVRLLLSGSDALIQSMRHEQIRLRLDLKKAAVGVNTFTITPEDITLPPGILLKRVTPQIVEVTLDAQVKKELPIQADFSGKLPENLILVSAKLTPEYIQVVGKHRVLENMSTIYTEKIPLDNIQSSGTIIVNPFINSTSIRIAQGGKTRIKVEYTVKER
ncbi:MAG: DNA integrity scanning protein DisA nucleotide-binding domain protein [Desulfobacterales bacterium]|nr:DNA integrity scanning protein DisA nucleotide-binding domain protein [Desulfobacterales bacterium]MBF0396961.1 DNA integrity scanning protein DisA nucleotide-binding domain protein [Desulfobacterales bacterium]